MDSNKDFYKGEWKQDKKHGVGIVYSDNKQFYIGEFKNDEYNCIGVNYNEDFTYEGEFEKGICKGVGIKTYNSEANNGGGEGNERLKFQGVWEKFKLNGVGEFYRNEKLVYYGEFMEGLYEGKGTKINENGSVYVGQFKNGDENGRGGLIVYVDNVPFKEKECEWKNGNKVGTQVDWVSYAKEVMNKLSRNKLAKEFNSPMYTIKNANDNSLKYADYNNKIKNPMDFGTIKVFVFL